MFELFWKVSGCLQNWWKYFYLFRSAGCCRGGDIAFMSVCRHLSRCGWFGWRGGYGFTMPTDIESRVTSSVEHWLFPTVGNKRASFSGEGDILPGQPTRVRRYYLGQRDLSRVVKEKTGTFLRNWEKIYPGEVVRRGNVSGQSVI